MWEAVKPNLLRDQDLQRFLPAGLGISPLGLQLSTGGAGCGASRGLSSAGPQPSACEQDIGPGCCFSLDPGTGAAQGDRLSERSCAGIHLDAWILLEAGIPFSHGGSIEICWSNLATELPSAYRWGRGSQWLHLHIKARAIWTRIPRAQTLLWLLQGGARIHPVPLLGSVLCLSACSKTGDKSPASSGTQRKGGPTAELSIGVHFQPHTSPPKVKLPSERGGRAFPSAQPQQWSHPLGQQHMGAWICSFSSLRVAVGLGEAAAQLGQLPAHRPRMKQSWAQLGAAARPGIEGYRDGINAPLGGPEGSLEVWQSPAERGGCH